MWIIILTTVLSIWFSYLLFKKNRDLRESPAFMELFVFIAGTIMFIGTPFIYISHITGEVNFFKLLLRSTLVCVVLFLLMKLIVFVIVNLFEEFEKEEIEFS